MRLHLMPLRKRAPERENGPRGGQKIQSQIKKWTPVDALRPPFQGWDGAVAQELTRLVGAQNGDILAAVK
jgi:hypothetical protein